MNAALENALKEFHIEGMLSHIAAQPEDFEALLDLSVGDEKHSWRAAWLIGMSMEKNDRRITDGHIQKIIDSLDSKADGHQRELMKVLLKLELDEKFESVLFDHCISIWEKIDKKPSVRSMALKMLLKIAEKHPDLANEISFLTESHYMDTLSPGIKQSVLRMIKKVP